MKGEIFPGSSGVSAPIGVQFFSRFLEMVWAFVEELTTPKRMDMLFAS
jgi:hypothetical protein